MNKVRKESQNENLIFYRIEDSGHIPSKKGMEAILSKAILLISK